MNLKIAVLPGDYIGPEVMDAALPVLEKTLKKHGHTLEYSVHPVGGAGIDACGKALPDETLAACDAAVDFSFHEATPALAEICAETGTPLVIGTTGHTPEERARIEAAAKKIPVVWAGNYSVGVNVLNWLVGKAAALLDSSFQVEVVEMHHRHKKDAPSGTAMRTAQIISRRRSGTDASGSSASVPATKSACILCAAGASSATTRSFSPARANASN